MRGMHTSDASPSSTQIRKIRISPSSGTRRKWARADLPVITPSTTRAKLARKLV
jgi:hypothetical protein